MKCEGTLLLSRSEVADLLSIEEYIAPVERVFQLYGDRKTQPPGILAVHAHDGGLHIKAGILELDRSFFAAKINANFPQNVKRFGLPLIQGAIFLADAQNGYPLAIMDSMEITIRRTGDDGQQTCNERRSAFPDGASKNDQEVAALFEAQNQTVSTNQEFQEVFLFFSLIIESYPR